MAREGRELRGYCSQLLFVQDERTRTLYFTIKHLCTVLNTDHARSAYTEYYRTIWGKLLTG